MTAELHHPRLGGRRFAENADVILAAPETDRRARLACRGAAGLQDLIGIDDFHRLLVPLSAEGGGDEREGGLFLRRRHIGELEAVPFGRANLHRDARGQVRPHDPRLLVEIEVGFPPLALVERRQKRVRGRHDTRRRPCRWGRLLQGSRYADCA